ncbi:hypothetical protein [Vibrio alginolyticus]|uniref:hypothetical protein n=1 Tax=Vibrio alginolyticus TaxID=663 RepID=UPI0011EE1F9A|nr:hypothetical protein [Vibrio alginolyticus]TYZ36866.1 hypothetical protein EWT61_10250 [Vibrio alginolyticus]
MLDTEIGRLQELIENDFNSESNPTTNVDLRTHLLNFCSFVQKNPTIQYYPISRLFEASGCSTPTEVLKVTNYLTSEEVGFLTITFCYYPHGSDDVIKVAPEDYRESLIGGIPPVDSETGEEIEDFDQSRLGFFCYVKALN